MAGLSTTNYAGPPAARSDGVVAFNRSRLIQIIIALVTVTLVFAPIVPILYQSFLDRPLYDHEAALTGQNYINLFASPVIWQVVFNSLLFAAATTIIAQIIGTFLAILVGRTDLPGRRILGDVILLPMFLSHLVLAFGWFIAYGPSGYITIWINNIFGGAPWNLYSLGGMAMIAGISQAPLAFLYCQASTALSDPSLEQAARSCGAGPIRTLWSVTLPLLMPAILSSGILTVTAALEMLAIPLIFGQPAGVNLFTTFLYEQGIATPRPDYGLVGTAATFLLVIVAALVFQQNRILRNSSRYIALFPRAVPGLVAGLGFFYAMTFLPGIGLLQNSIWLLALAYIMRHIPTGYGSITPSLMQIGTSIDRAAKVAGADWWTTSHAILLPIMRPALFACFSLLFIQFFKEYTVALFLFSPDTEVIGVTLLRRWGQGEVARVAALSTIQVLITVGFVYGMRRFLGVKFYG